MGKAEDNEAFVREVQHRLGVRVDGWAGAETLTALGRVLLPALFDPNGFYTEARRLFGKLSQSQVDGINAILSVMKGAPLAHTAYALATAWHEVDKTMQPIAEYGKGKGKPYGRAGRNNGQIAYGRGYVQLTWDDNYERMDRALGLRGRLIANYELALDAQIAADIMRVGMDQGLFTTKKFSDYLPASGPATLDQFIAARRIINGTDKAALIAGYAMLWMACLQAGGWR